MIFYLTVNRKYRRHDFTVGITGLSQVQRDFVSTRLNRFPGVSFIKVETAGIPEMTRRHHVFLCICSGFGHLHRHKVTSD